MKRIFLVAALCGSVAHAQTPLSRDGLAIDSALRLLEAQGFSGVVRVERGNDVLLERGYGLANRATRLAFSAATVVQIGSNTKDFTVVALLQLHERGRLGLQDSLAKFFPSAPADKRNITLQQLMNHTAGFPQGLGGDFEPLTRAQFIDRAMSQPLLFAPGSRELYSNAGFSLLAAVIEMTSGQTYDNFVNDNILNPLGLTHTGYLLPRFDLATVAHGYRGAEDIGDILSKPHATDGPYWNLRGNGGMVSTVGDMHAFYKALFETDRLMKPSTRALRFHPDEPIGLAGSDMVSAFLFERLPGRRIEIIIATNNSAFRERAVRGAIGAALGLPSPDGQTPMANAGRRPAGTPVPLAVAQLLRDFVATINTGDRAKIGQFVADHFAAEPGAPSAEQRTDRFTQMHTNLGALSIGAITQQGDTTELTAMSATEGAVVFGVQVGSDGKIHGVQARVGS